MKIKKSIYFSILLTLFFVANNVSAADFRIATKNNSNVYIEQGEEIKNLYTAGNIVSIDSNIEKGLHAAGNVVTINGEIGGTVYSGAGTLIINGNIGGSVHGAGGSIIVNNKVTDDLLLGGGNIVISKTALIGGDLFIGGGTIDIQGSITGDTYLGGGMITINGEIGGNLKIVEGDKIIIGSKAKINGNLEYHSKNEIIIEEGAVILGETTIKAKNGISGDDSQKGALLSMIFIIISISVLIKIVGLIIVGLMLIYLFKNITERIVRESLTNFWKNLGIALVIMIVAPITAILLLITLVGIWLGIIIGVLYMLSIFLAVSLSGITFGSWLTKIIKKRNNYSVNWKVVVGGVISLILVGLIPIVGWLILIIFTLISLGGTYRLIYKTRK